MRQIVLDTETTGLNCRMGDRVIEIGCVEILNRRLTGNRFHRYVNPEREIEGGALQVHGITNDFLADKPRFSEVVEEFLDYVRGAELIIHNAAFDVEFLNYELDRIGAGTIEGQVAGILDTLSQARELHPGRKNSLDALCERYQVENAHRTLHGALLDAELLAEVYLAMTRGQESLAIELEVPRAAPILSAGAAAARPALLVLRASEAEGAEHIRILQGIAKEARSGSVWLTEPPADG
jgi:DNA polymerase III subunit epsilon